MKKQTALTIALLIALGGLAACSARKEHRTDNEVIEQFNEIELDEFNENTQSTVKSTTFIGEEKAKELVAARAGAAIASINFNKIELDEEDNVWKYEAEFTYNGTSYSVEVNASNGEIIKWEKENNE